MQTHSASLLTPRTPEISEAEAPLDWSKIPEFSHYFNGISFLFPPVEHYLNNVIGEVVQGHCADNPALTRELKDFIQQETNHSIYHQRFNRRMLKAGHAGLKDRAEAFNGDLKKLRATKSLAFNVAYCAGFENGATFSTVYFLTQCDDLFEGADPRAANLLLWHFAEEFEHRAACHHAFAQVSGNYFTRIYGLIYSMIHLNAGFSGCANAVLDKYRAGLSPEEAKQSRKLQARLARRQALFVLPRLILLFIPGFNPAKIKIPPRVQSALDFYAKQGPILESVP